MTRAQLPSGMQSLLSLQLFHCWRTSWGPPYQEIYEVTPPSEYMLMHRKPLAKVAIWILVLTLSISHRKFFSECPAILHALSHLYAQRSSTLWKPKARTAWFTTTVNSLDPFSNPSEHPTTQAFHSLYSSPPIRYSVYRHLLVLESTCRRLFAFIPATVTEGRQFSCDPIPPPTKINEYNDEFFKGAEDPLALRARGKRETERLLVRLLPDPLLRRQLQVSSRPFFRKQISSFTDFFSRTFLREIKPSCKGLDAAVSCNSPNSWRNYRRTH